MDAIRIRTLLPEDAPAVARFADRFVGVDYYPAADLLDYLARTTVGAITTSYVAEQGDRVVGFRIVMPPGRWASGRGNGLTPERWPHPLEATAYFQSCFVDTSLTGQGLGRRLAQVAFDDLRRLGARAVAVHSWKESPNDSSRRYLTRLGFRTVAEYPHYWRDVDYLCAGCRVKPCTCTAIEMILDLEAK